MKADYVPALQPRGPSTLRCGRTDCRWYASVTDSCDYMLRNFCPRGCPAAPDCARFEPAEALSPRESLKMRAGGLDFFRL